MRWLLLTIVTLSLVLITPAVESRPSWPGRIPNGDVYSCNTCHRPDMSRNAFGLDFDEAGRAWTSGLAALDSDDDGFANGVELQDPAGTWQQGDPDPGDPAAVSNPGSSQSMAVAATTWGAIKEIFASVRKLLP